MVKPGSTSRSGRRRPPLPAGGGPPAPRAATTGGTPRRGAYRPGRRPVAHAHPTRRPEGLGLGEHHRPAAVAGIALDEGVERPARREGLTVEERDGGDGRRALRVSRASRTTQVARGAPCGPGGGGGPERRTSRRDPTGRTSSRSPHGDRAGRARAPPGRRRTPAGWPGRRAAPRTPRCGPPGS